MSRFGELSRERFRPYLDHDNPPDCCGALFIYGFDSYHDSALKKNKKALVMYLKDLTKNPEEGVAVIAIASWQSKRVGPILTASGFKKVCSGKNRKTENVIHIYVKSIHPVKPKPKSKRKA